MKLTIGSDFVPGLMLQVARVIGALYESSYEPTHDRMYENIFIGIMHVFDILGLLLKLKVISLKLNLIISRT